MNLQRIAQNIFNNVIKFNYKCGFGEFVPDSFKCGNTPEEAKKNYESSHKKSTLDSNKKSTLDSNKSKSELRGLVDKIDVIRKSGDDVPKRLVDELKSRVESIKNTKVGGSSAISRKIYDMSSVPNTTDKIGKVDAIKTASASDTYAQMDIDLGKISSSSSKFKEVSGNVNENTAKVIHENAKKEVRRYEMYLSGDALNLLRDYVEDTNNLIRSDSFSKMDASVVDDLVRDSIKKLVFQEVESSRKTFSDHGVRHIIGNISRQMSIMDAMGSKDPKERLMASFIMINHDIGYTAPLIRDSSRGSDFSAKMSKYHPDMSAKILEEQRDIWNKDKVFSSDEYDRIIGIVRTHDSTEIDKNDILGTSTRLSDNLSLFASEKLPSLFRYVDGAKDVLVKMGQASKEKNNDEFETLRSTLFSMLDDNDTLSNNIKRDLKMSVSTIDSVTPKFNMGSLAGEISSIGKDGDLVVVDVDYNEFDRDMQNIFDMGQRQTKKFLDSYGITDYSKDEYDIGGIVKIKINKSREQKMNGSSIDIQKNVRDYGEQELKSVNDDIIKMLRDVGFFDSAN